jgi:hypothetical protein
VGALGGLAKLLIDRRKADSAEAAELRDRQCGYIDMLVGVSHDVDNARPLIRANRTIRTWTDVISGAIVPACARLRDFAPDLTNWEQAGVTLFRDREALNQEPGSLVTYLSDLIDEHADSKQPLAELQRAAEATTGDDRLQARPHACIKDSCRRENPPGPQNPPLARRAGGPGRLGCG